MPLYGEKTIIDTSMTRAIIVEGEPKVDRLAAVALEIGAVVTCTFGGAARWKWHDFAGLRQFDVVVLPDHGRGRDPLRERYRRGARRRGGERHRRRGHRRFYRKFTNVLQTGFDVADVHPHRDRDLAAAIEALFLDAEDNRNRVHAVARLFSETLQPGAKDKGPWSLPQISGC